MNRLTRCLGLAAAAALFACCSAYPAAALGSTVEPLRITVAFTGDVIGYLEPCG